MQTINFHFDAGKVVRRIRVVNEDVEVGYLDIEYFPNCEEIIVFLGNDKDGDE